MKKLLYLFVFVSANLFGQSLQLPYPYKNINATPGPIDFYYYNSSRTPYTNTAQVIAQVTSGLRYIGQTFNVNGVEYWFFPGVVDANLVTKIPVLPLSIANGGTGTTSPGIVAGTNVTVSGTWPNQTVNSSQTNITGNAATVTTNANLTGDVTSSGNATTLSNTAVTPAAYTNANITVDSKGRITTASNGSAGGSGWGVTGTTTLTGAATIVGTTTNTIKHKFDALGTTLTNGAGLYLHNTTAALTGAQQISPIITSEGSSFTANATPSQTVGFQQYCKPLQSSNALGYGDYWFDTQLNGGTPTHTLGIKNTNVLSMPGTNAYANASGIEIYKNSTPSTNNATVFIGAQGNTEINLSYNMDYHNVAVNEHHYYDDTKDAVWYYQSPAAGWGVQATKAGYTNTAGSDVWTQGGSAAPIKFTFLKNGSGDYVTGGNAFTGQQINIIDDNYSSPNGLLKLHGTIFSFTGMDNVQVPKINAGTGTMPANCVGYFNYAGGNTYVEFANTDNNTNYNRTRFVKNKAGSYNLGTGTKIFEYDYNGGVGFSGVRATSTVISSFSNLEYYWQTTKSTGGVADRMVLSEDGKLSVTGSIVTPTIFVGSTSRTPSSYLQFHSGTSLAGTAPMKLRAEDITILTCSGSGTIATLTFAAQTVAPFDVGQTIIVAGETPTGYNGTFVVLTCSTTAVTYSNTTTGSQAVAGTITTGILATPEAGAFGEYDGTRIFATNNGLIQQELLQGQQARVVTQVDVTSSTTLANATFNNTINVAAGKTYAFESTLYTSSNVGGGVKFAIAGTATATNIIYDGITIDANTNSAQTRATALATSVGAATAVTNALTKITGTITVSTAGTLAVQFAQNASNASASSILAGSYLLVRQVK